MLYIPYCWAGAFRIRLITGVTVIVEEMLNHIAVALR
jgi:hypothetical protein